MIKQATTLVFEEKQASLPLPIAGLLSDRSMDEVVEKIEEVVEAARNLGSTLLDPFMTLSFLCLPVIPELKLTDWGLVDVNRFDFVPLFVGGGKEIHDPLFEDS